MEFKKDIITNLATKSFNSVFRTKKEAPGFVHLKFHKEDFTPFQFRGFMIGLKKELSQLTLSAFQQKLESHWLVRFDQQENTPFHVDNAATHSILLLGYEPSEVSSELLLADYHTYAHQTFDKPSDYFHKFTPVFKEEEDVLTPFTTNININTKNHYSIVMMNNSSPTIEATTFGVFHKAVIPVKDKSKSRIVNSMVLNIVAADVNIDDTEKENQFLNHTMIHK